MLLSTIHPRACGEHARILGVTESESGSSPRIRGTRYGPPQPKGNRRFIPAHAGNTLGIGCTLSVSTVHPRACGEHYRHPYTTHTYCGSSPRMRGTRCGPAATKGNRRFIPAHAGNTDPSHRKSSAYPVHPRACGEHDQALHVSLADAGSSPRMRGTLLPKSGKKVKHRFIPAHAGNTWRYRKPPRAISVHPRACGEHIAVISMPFRAIGSSPRMRGTRFRRDFGQVLVRFIPAHAGNTLGDGE